jgi:hypothetical protein
MSQIGFLTSRFFTTWLSTLILTWPNPSASSSSSSFWGWTMLSHKFSQDLNVFLSITKRRILKKKGEKKHPWCNSIYEVQIGINSCCSLKIYPSCTIPHSMGQQSCWIGVLQTYPNPLKFNPAYSAVKWVTTTFQTPSLTYSLFFPECGFEHPSMKQTIDPIP